MFIAMNRFRIHKGYEAEFERIWAERDSHLKSVPGFIAFNLLRGPAHDDHTLYASHSTWESRDAFDAWTRSEAFKEAHRNAGDHRHIYMEAPALECFEVIQEE
ncbi:antibiotic biosynthesis monooxygenase family protein [Aquisalimonas asiatica]|uniref:Heme-degrading monooxygenase HmoA n=1 Tax=Aquisalimonas asiatica TaxID=406100 RepID=A0A1H8THU2_9GAMM|nr:antibiotic biosynthesis monooxygenase [Aquisalimonas asiatica]SEO90689.1 Heme-degrading monooxygenase HmoA [Aquisalimonas asiatica]